MKIRFNLAGILSFLLAFLFLFPACTETKKKAPLKIAVSYLYGPKNKNSYVKWLKRTEPEIECIDMYHISPDSVMPEFNECSGLLLTGGNDVFPGRYGKEYDTVRCGKINYRRDTLEFELIKIALRKKLPILGVCRGEQILNVALGGSLIVDIPSDFDTTIKHRCKNPKKCFHIINIFEDNILYEISGAKKGYVNSNHHQAVDLLADDLKVLAKSEDGLIEAVGWENPEGKQFLLAVQWHPERMDTANIFSMPLAKKFIEASEEYGSMRN